jgi:hypothetical protein
MNHEAEVRMTGISKTDGRIGLHANARVGIVVPISSTFGGPPRPPAREMKVDSAKVEVKKG